MLYIDVSGIGCTWRLGGVLLVHFVLEREVLLRDGTLLSINGTLMAVNVPRFQDASLHKVWVVG